MKIVFFGTPEIAAPVLETLTQISNIEILSVVTQPDKPVGRKGKITPPPIKTVAEKHNLKILQPHTKKELQTALKDIKADFFIVIAYGMILPKEVLKIPKYGAINIHYSLLPKYRGASPIQESLLNGDTETGISIIKMDEELDHGPIILMKRMKIEDNDNLQTLSKKLSVISSQILPLALEDIIESTLHPIEQNHSQATFCKKTKKSDGKINWNTPAKDIKNMIRAYTPWPSVFTEIKGKKIKILEADIEKSAPTAVPGKFVIENKTLKISTKKGYLIPKVLQPEGKKEMDIKTFLNGYQNLLKTSN